jgi:hypothetical protein
MSTKMVIYTNDEHSKILEYGTDYTDFKINDGVLAIYLNFQAIIIYAEGSWKKIEFNRDK